MASCPCSNCPRRATRRFIHRRPVDNFALCDRCYDLAIGSAKTTSKSVYEAASVMIGRTIEKTRENDREAFAEKWR